LAIASAELTRRRQHGRDGRLTPAPAPGVPDLEDEQLVEREPLPARLRLPEGARLVEREEGVGLERQALGNLEPRGERVGKRAGVRKCALDERSQPLRRDLLTRGVDRREVGGRSVAVQILE